MAQYIDKVALVAEIERRINNLYPKGGQGMVVTKILKDHYEDLLSFINTLEVKDPYITCIQYTNREAAIKAHAEDYSWNIESELFQQLTPEQQKLWRKEIEQACISGGYCGIGLAKDRRYDDTLEVKEVGVDVGSPEGDWSSKTVQVIDADGYVKEIKIQKGKKV